MSVPDAAPRCQLVPKPHYSMITSLIISLLTLVHPSLKDLDRVVNNYSVYEAKRLEKIETCKAKLDTATQVNLAAIYDELFSLYYSFQVDSAMVYAHKGIELCRELADPEGEQNALLNLASSYQARGLYYEAMQLMAQVSEEKFEIRLASLYNTIYSALVTLSTDPSLDEEYDRKAKYYKQLLLDNEPDLVYVICDTLIQAGKVREALDIIKPFCDSLDISDPAVGPAAYSVANVQGRLGDYKSEKQYYITSAYNDLVSGNKEYLSLVKLAIILYREGDLNRAYSYINRAIGDASYCGALIRIEEVSLYIPVIVNAYNKVVKNNYTAMSITIIFLLILGLGIFAMSMKLNKQKKSLSDYNRQLIISHSLQEEANSKTREASNIKNTYITQLMLECISRIERMEEYKNKLKRLAQTSDLDELKKELRSTALVEAEWKSFYNVFDTTFLSLFPSFVKDLNALLQEESRFSEDTSGGLSAELRIYAMIRLDIDSTDKIASLLRYSKATIYAYRSRTRLKALNPASFEEDVKRIASI